MRPREATTFPATISCSIVSRFAEFEQLVTINASGLDCTKTVFVWRNKSYEMSTNPEARFTLKIPHYKEKQNCYVKYLVKCYYYCTDRNCILQFRTQEKSGANYEEFKPSAGFLRLHIAALFFK